MSLSKLYKTVLSSYLKTVFILCCLSLSACKSTQKIAPTANNLTALSQAQQKKASKSNRHQYKYVSETAVLFFYEARHAEAEKYFEKAWQLQDKAYTRSTTELILSKIVNENTKQFRGHYLERWHLRYLACINYLSQNKIESALIELRRLSRDCRKDKDPFQEKIIDQARHAYLLHTGVLFSLLGRPEEGKADLRYLQNQNYSFPQLIAKQDWFWNNRPQPKKFNETKLIPSNSKQQLKLNLVLKGLGPQKKEQRMNITMLGILPLIQGYMEGNSDDREIEQATDIVTGVLGKRLIEIAYPVMDSQKFYEIDDKTIRLNFGRLFHDSWDAQKNRLIAQSALRVISKVYASYQVEHAIEKSVEGPWGQLLGNIGRLALWKTEQADIRQIKYMPYGISFDWEWVEATQPEISIQRKSLF